MSDEEIEKKCDEVWSEAEKKYNITEAQIFSLMGDTDLLKEYYSSGSNSNSASNSTESNIITYDATLKNNGYRVTVVSQQIIIPTYCNFTAD